MSPIRALLPATPEKTTPVIRSCAGQSRASCPLLGDMTIRRMDHVGVLVDDLAAAIAFFVELV